MSIQVFANHAHVFPESVNPDGTASGTVTLSGPNVPGGTATYSGTASVGGTNLAATPELGSLALFGTGAAGMAGYVLMRARARRRR